MTDPLHHAVESAYDADDRLLTETRESGTAAGPLADR